MAKSAIIFFVCNPEPGKVKPAIASQMGETAAVDIYKKLRQHTKTITQTITGDVFVFCSENNIVNDLWNEPPFFKRTQQGHDVASRLINAFETVFARGYKKVAYVCTDCLDMDKKTLADAFKYLDQYDVVIGPSEEGRIYLLAVNSFTPALFKNINWTHGLTQQLQKAAELQQLSVRILPTLAEVETAEDCKKYPQLA